MALAVGVSFAIAACGSDAASRAPSATSTTSTTTTSTTVMTPVDGLDPADWIGHAYAEDALAAPFQHAVLDGVITDDITLRIGVTHVPDPAALPAFVRPDPGGYGHSETEPGPWLVLAWQLGDPADWSAGGTVTDALLTTSVEFETPMTGCRPTDGGPGVYLGFVLYDPTYPTDGTDTAPFPVTQAWRITDDLRLEAVDPAGVECDWFEFGD
jgi:hypothetical protein